MLKPPDTELPMSLMTMRDYIAVHSEIDLELFNDQMLTDLTGRPNPTGYRPHGGSIEYVVWLMEAEAKLAYMRADAFMRAKNWPGT